MLPVLQALAGDVRMPISIDTYKADVAARRSTTAPRSSTTSAGFEYDPDLGPLVAARGAPVILMHTRGRPERHVRARRLRRRRGGRLARPAARHRARARVRRARAIASSSTRVWVSPSAPSTASRRWPASIASPRSACPLLVGPSRKSFLTAATGPLDGRRPRLGDGRRGHRRGARRRAHRPRPPRRGDGAGGARRRRDSGAGLWTIARCEGIDPSDERLACRV